MFCCSCGTKTVTLKSRLATRLYPCVPWMWWRDCKGPAPASESSPDRTGLLQKRVWSPRRIWEESKVKEDKRGESVSTIIAGRARQKFPQQRGKDNHVLHANYRQHRDIWRSGCKHVCGCWQDSVWVCDLEFFNGHWPDLLQSFKSKSITVLEITVWRIQPQIYFFLTIHF